MKNIKTLGYNYFHRHPKLEKLTDLDVEHVIIDFEAYNDVICFFNNNKEALKMFCDYVNLEFTNQKSYY
jgi:hypothetical protein